MATYNTRHGAILNEIIAPIEASGIVKDAEAEYDISAIADRTIISITSANGHRFYECIVTAEEFWQIVEENEVAK